MMLLSLIKKDFLIVKKYVLIMFLFMVLVPPLLRWQLPEFTGVLGFTLSVLFVVFMLLQSVSQKEYQFPKAATLLCTTPFPRKMIVLSKYIFCMVSYMGCCIVYRIETLLIPGLGTFDIKLFALMFLTTSVFISIYLPIEYKFGYEKTKFFVVIYVVSPHILPRLLGMNNLNFVFLSMLSPYLVYGSIVLIGLAILAISAYVSMGIYDKADLA